jgi:muconolactone delta-isomerase
LSGLGQGHEFLVDMTIIVPDGTPATVVDDKLSREAQRARELSGQGHLRRLWKLPSENSARRTLGLWNAREADELLAIMRSLPLYEWMTVKPTMLSPHPSDPVGTSAA